MSSCCSTLQGKFDRRAAAQDLRRFRRRGALPGTRKLIDALAQAGASGRLLDVGAGVGAVHLAMLRRGVVDVLVVDASAAYTEAARALAREQGVDARIRYRVGDFVELADDIDPADVVTLDRVICCYSDWRPLVTLSASRARRLYGIVVPRDRAAVRLGVRLTNAFYALVRDPFRIFFHPPAQIAEQLGALGFRGIAEARTIAWQVLVFERVEPAPI